jgi:hypothetical protein
MGFTRSRALHSKYLTPNDIYVTLDVVNAGGRNTTGSIAPTGVRVDR